MLKPLVVAAISVGALKGVASGSEVVRHDAFLYDIGDIVHIIYSHIALVLRVHPIELLQLVDCDCIAGGVIAGKRAVGIFDEDSASYVLLPDSAVDSLGLGGGGLVEDHYFGICDAVDSKL